jgi:predicted Ser/Thr protein kinase
MNVIGACQVLLDFEDGQVRDNVSNILLNFALNKANRSIILNQNGMRALVELLRIDDVSSEHASEHAVEALSNLTQNKLNQDNFRMVEGIPSLIPFLNVRRDDIRKNAALALFWMAENELSREDIRTNGGVTYLVRCLKNSAHRVAEFSAGALYHLADNEINQAAISEAGAIPPLISNLSAPSEPLRQNAAGLLSSLAKIDSNKVAIREAGAIPILIPYLREGSVQLRRNVVVTLVELVKSELNHVHIREHYGICALIQCVRDTDEVLSIEAAKALSDLAKMSENRGVIGQENGIPILIQNLGRHAKLSLHVASALSHLASDETHQNAIRQAGGIIALLDLLRLCDEQTRIHVVIALHALSSDRASLIQMKVGGAGMSTIIPLLTDPNSQTRQYATTLLQRLNTCGIISRQEAGCFLRPAAVSITDIPLSELTIGNKKLGEGGFGVVKAATWLGHTKVVIKKRRDNRQSSAFLDDLKKEATIHSRLSHPNILTMYGTCGENATYGLVLEYMSGGSLDLMLSKMPKNKQISSSVAAGIAQGLHYLHGLGIVHCDLKSANVLMKDKMFPEISDFGHAKVLPRLLTSSLATVESEGTTGWMAPEVLRDGRSSKASDVYSFAVILWELATRRIPFAHDSRASITQKVKAGEKPGDLLQIEGNTSVPYARLIASCWKDRAKERPTIESAETSLQEMKIKLS